MRNKFLSIVLLTAMLLTAACTAQATPTVVPTTAAPAATTEVATTPVPTTLTVLAASSLTEPFNEMKKGFEAAHPGVTVEYSFAGSQALVQQLSQGAAADVFASASASNMNDAVKANRVSKDAVQTFAMNKLVVIYPSDNPAKISTLTDMVKSGVKIDIADESVPVGKYALTFLDNASKDKTYGSDFKANFLKNVVSKEDNVKAVLTKVSLGEADAGIVYISDISGDYASKVGKLYIPDSVNAIASYPIAPISDSKNADLAKAFVAYVLAKDGQDILQMFNL